MSLRDELLIPFRGASSAWRDLLAGSGVLIRCACRGIRRGFVLAGRAAWHGATVGDRLESLGIAALLGGAGLVVTAGGVGLLVWVVSPYAPVISGVGVVGWLVAAWAVAPPRETATQNDHEKLPGEQHAETAAPAQDQSTAELWLVRLVLVGVRDAVAAGRKGVHLATLLESANVDWDVATLRQHCRRLDIPTKKINIRGQGSTWGVHVDELEAVLGGPVDAALDALDATPAAGPVEGPEEAPARAEEEAPPEATPLPTLRGFSDPPQTPSLRPQRDPSPPPVAARQSPA